MDKRTFSEDSKNHSAKLAAARNYTSLGNDPPSALLKSTSLVKVNKARFSKLNVSTTMVNSYWQQNSALQRKNRMSTKSGALVRAHSFGARRKFESGPKDGESIAEEHDESNDKAGMSDYGIFRSPIHKRKAPAATTVDDTLFLEKKNLWQRFEDYFWL